MVVIENLVRTNERTSAHRIRLAFPVFVDPGIPIKKVHEIAEVEEYLSSGVFCDGNPISEVPYIYWLHSFHRGRSAEDARDQFESDEVGITLFEMSSLYLYRPDLIENYAFGAGEVGFEFNGTKYHPRLSRLGRGGAKLDVVDADFKSSHYGILTRSKEVYLPASAKP